MNITRYEDFIDRVDELGFMPMSTLSHVLPTLSEVTEGQWHAGNAETDPWEWKDKVVVEKRLAYGSIFGGHKGFISARLYPIFYAAYQPEEFMEERWISGMISPATWKLWQLFEDKGSLDTIQLKSEMGGKADTSIVELQRDFYITISGNRHKRNKQGEPYGWPSCLYERVIDWAPQGWMDGTENIKREDAREQILDMGMAMGKCANRQELAKALRLS